MRVGPHLAVQPTDRCRPYDCKYAPVCVSVAFVFHFYFCVKDNLALSSALLGHSGRPDHTGAKRYDKCGYQEVDHNPDKIAILNTVKRVWFACVGCDSTLMMGLYDDGFV
ncbi:MAG TPA: hypothetical protein DD666_11325 [Advenella kashmirensis]|uniref:Uncharacterized protein n=1 Tax=Advenella kashmirensis TaxID=310575 RepID=A0A356LGE5_9BURK|nr:hypothetical protein [Advenella kashmirensis]